MPLWLSGYRRQHMIIVIEETWFSYLFGHRFSHSIVILNPAIFLIERKFLFHIFYLALDTEVVVSQNGSQVSQAVQMPNLLCAVCLFFSSCAICVVLYASFFSACAICVCESINLIFVVVSLRVFSQNAQSHNNF